MVCTKSFFYPFYLILCLIKLFFLLFCSVLFCSSCNQFNSPDEGKRIQPVSKSTVWLQDAGSAQLAAQIIAKHSKLEKIGSSIQSNGSLSFSFGGVIGGPGAVQVGIFVGGNGVLAPQYTS